ncbi:MAG TPA: HAD-IIIA family hydrolase [Acidobacteriota bacterium]|nr:HAD-IIIA family hydrolase [Acidobacteriota bacterium]
MTQALSTPISKRIPRSRPTQAVILAGGEGTRLRPITYTRPKPMVEFHGKPFLEYIVEMLRDQGFRKILFLLGYLPQVIQSHFGDGSRWGVDIDYSISKVEDLTARRVELAAHRLDPCFLLLYCDNYWPMRFEPMWKMFLQSGARGLVTVYRNRDQYSRDSVRVGSDGFVEVFDRSRTSPGLKGVEISYAILDRSVIGFLPRENQLFEESVYPALTARRELVAFETDHRYYSVGSLERLPLTESFLARRATVILDRDGVLNRKPPKARYVRRWEDFQWLPGALESLRLLRENGYRVIVVTNQAGVARGEMTEQDLLDIHRRMCLEVRSAGGDIEAVYYCPHGWDEGCECRKPKPGMLFRAQRDFHLDLTRTLFIGDDERDAEAGHAAGCRTILVTPDRSLLQVVGDLLQQNRRGWSRWEQASAY